MTPQQQVEKLLLRHIRPGYSEDKPSVRIDIRSVAKRTTNDQALVFATIHEEAMKIVDRNAFRTRTTKNTSFVGVGFTYYDRPIVTNNGPHKEVMSCLFPMQGSDNRLLFYFRGVGEDPYGRAHPWKEGAEQKIVMKFDVPALRADQPADHETSQWAISLLEVGFAHIKSL